MSQTNNYSIQFCSNFSGVITNEKIKEDVTKREYIVSLAFKTCTCGHYHDMEIPCLHVSK